MFDFGIPLKFQISIFGITLFCFSSRGPARYIGLWIIKLPSGYLYGISSWIKWLRFLYNYLISQFKSVICESHYISFRYASSHSFTPCIEDICRSLSEIIIIFRILLVCQIPDAKRYTTAAASLFKIPYSNLIYFYFVITIRSIITIKIYVRKFTGDKSITAAFTGSRR